MATKPFLLGLNKDEKSINIWLDWWHSDGILYERHGYRVVYDAVSKVNAKLESVLKGKEWFWPPARSEEKVS